MEKYINEILRHPTQTSSGEDVVGDCPHRGFPNFLNGFGANRKLHFCQVCGNESGKGFLFVQLQTDIDQHLNLFFCDDCLSKANPEK